MSLEDVTKEELFKVLESLAETFAFGRINDFRNKPKHDPPKWESGFDSEGLNTENLPDDVNNILNRLYDS